MDCVEEGEAFSVCAVRIGFLKVFEADAVVQAQTQKYTIARRGYWVKKGQK